MSEDKKICDNCQRRETIELCPNDCCDGTNEIVICLKCNGKGTIEKSELADYHRGEYDYWDEVCPKCKGSGRLLRTVVLRTIETPYNNEKIPELIFNKLKET